MDRYAVVGYPVAHSKSPFIHAMFAEQTKQVLTYDRLEAAPEQFQSAVRDFFAAGGKGLNVTVPHKESAFELVEQHSPEALKAGAVNTIYRTADGRLAAANTDGIRLVRDIVQNHGCTLQGAVVLILGAGGAVRGLLPRLIAAKPRRIVIANRTESRAQALAQLFAEEFAIDTCAYDALENVTPDWIINGSAAGLSGDMPVLPASLIASHTCCYDMVYAPGGTVFQHWATRQGARLSLDGTGMLVEQAAESFYIWRGIRPDTGPVLSALRHMLAA